MASFVTFRDAESGLTTGFSPDLVTEWETTRTGGNIVHDIIGAASPTVTYKYGSLRAGTLHMLFSDAAEAKAIQDIAVTPGYFRLSDPDIPDNFMTFVVPEGGNVTRTLDDQTRALWLVAIDYREIDV